MMTASLLAAAALAITPTPDDARAAIWGDLQLNAMIGNGNRLASLWYNAGAENPPTPDLHIRDLACHKQAVSYRCTFTLVRDGGVVTLLGEAAPDVLTCEADLRQGGQAAWTVEHLPPSPRRGHSRTTMRCKRSPQGAAALSPLQTSVCEIAKRGRAWVGKVVQVRARLVLDGSGGVLRDSECPDVGVDLYDDDGAVQDATYREFRMSFDRELLSVGVSHKRVNLIGVIENRGRRPTSVTSIVRLKRVIWFSSGP